jgi:type I restriction enzyme R subunit
MVLVASEQKLLMMRPYQVYAVSTWWSASTRTAATAISGTPPAAARRSPPSKPPRCSRTTRHRKCLFVVDRKDLDRQTREEFNRFQEGCVEENTNTAALVRRLLSDDYADKVIVTTIQKLGLALDENSKRNKQQKRTARPPTRATCTAERQAHRLHLRRMPPLAVWRQPQGHQGVFPKAQLFGFTGTPIFEKNATVKQIEGERPVAHHGRPVPKQLHAYTITHAIEDATSCASTSTTSSPKARTAQARRGRASGRH